MKKNHNSVSSLLKGRILSDYIACYPILAENRAMYICGSSIYSDCHLLQTGRFCYKRARFVKRLMLKYVAAYRKMRKWCCRNAMRVFRFG